MRWVYAVFILLLVLMTSAQCQHTAEDWFDIGFALQNQSKLDAAIKAYDEALRLDPDFAAAWNSKGLALMNQGKYDEALKACDEAIRLDPNLARAWNNKGMALMALGRTPEAEAVFAKAGTNGPASFISMFESSKLSTMSSG